MKRLFMCVCAALAVALCYSVAGHRVVLGQESGDLVMVVNKTNAAEVSSAKPILLGETSTWPNKAKVVIALPPSGSSDRETILKKACGMNDTIYTRRVMLASFNGTGAISLHDAPSAAAVKSFVSANPGGVGFLHKSDVDASVRVALTLQ